MDEEQKPRRTRKKSEDLTPEEREFFRKQGKRVKTLGSSIERLYAKEYRQLWDKCKTSRLASKLLDNCGVDLAFIPINAQIKAGAQRGLSVSTVLKEMQEAIEKNFPEDDPIRKVNLNVVIHHKVLEQHSGERRSPTDVMVHMTHDTFFDLISRLYEKGKYLPKVIVVDENSKEIKEEENSTEAL